MDNISYDKTTTSILNISSNNIKDCNDITNLLLKCGIIGSVTPNKSVCCNKKKCWIENGCSITLCGLKPDQIEKKIWNPLKSKYDLKCAHLNIHGYYIGCILNFLEPSRCNWN